MGVSAAAVCKTSSGGLNPPPRDRLAHGLTLPDSPPPAGGALSPPPLQRQGAFTTSFPAPTGSPRCSPAGRAAAT